MLKRIGILVVMSSLLLSVSVLWALTPHSEYSILEIRECNSCHQESGVLQNHGSFWVEEHRLFAEKRPNNCEDCHQKSYCSECHFGGNIEAGMNRSNFGADLKPRSHRSDFRELHPIKALDDPKSCVRCHDQRGFCNECHSKFNPTDLRMLSHRKGFSSIELTQAGPQHEIFTVDQCQTCHPGGMLPSHQWSSSHAREARKNLMSCQSCHPEGDVCLTCHSAMRGLMVNPHPRNWNKISQKMGRASNNRTCIKCH